MDLKLLKKRIFVFLLVSFVLLSITILPASALDAEFSASADYTALKTGDTFNVRVAVNNIKNSEGIILVQFELHFDSRYLEYLEYKNNKPESWGDGFEEIVAPKVDENNPDDIYLSVAYMYADKGTGKGIKEDGILYTDITFKVLSDEANGTLLRLEDTEILDDSNKYVSCNTLNLKIDFDGAKVIAVSDGNNTENSSFDYDNALKIVIAAAAVLITAGGSIYIGKYLRQKQA